MVALPFLIPLTFPFLSTDAIFLSLVVQVIVVGLVSFGENAVTLSDTVFPLAKEADFVLSVMLFAATEPTVSVNDCFLLPVVAVIFAVPGFRAVTTLSH